MTYAIRGRRGGLDFLREAVTADGTAYRAHPRSWHLALGRLGHLTRTVLTWRYGLDGREIRSARETASAIRAQTVYEVYPIQYAGLRELRKALRVPE